ncbi:FAD/NAD(P)-binding oxidoreductase family protein isoform 1 [Theobroma cacao]|uniref:FAD/NAD(P)-binding oxidoreductase family protein isoform 1 n=1 Tax=Theobroma cacao TaxID=3641 RepID=A0A061F9W8_THECC|nr:FAD/NAD(P)-binding oxidoreductase family protein isoform 1 [Theobroma cacao]
MQDVVTKVAVVGSGISGAVCAATLARNGISVTLFDSARGPGGRMSQRREITEDGKELLFDHGAPYFTVTNPDVLSVVAAWESSGLVAEWKINLGSFDCFSNKFVNVEHQERQSKKYVGVPGMNSICKALCHEPGVESKFNVGVRKFEWLENENLWLLTGLDGQNLGHFKGVVASDKNIVSPRFTEITGQSPPLDLSLAPELVKLQKIPVNPCFALMLAFTDPLPMVPAQGFSFTNSKVLSWAFCESSKPGRSSTSERWVLHSTMEYAKDVIAQTGLQKPSRETLSKVGNEMLQEFLGTGLSIPQPFFKKAHRWGSAFPAASIAKEEKCLWDEKKRLAICGDFCVSPNVEGAILSGLAAASKLKGMLRSLF